MSRGLLGAAVLFWGWQTGALPVALVMAAIVESRVLISWRWDFTRADFNRASDLSALLLLAVGVYQALTNDSARAVTGVIQWLPFVVLPLVACQLYSVAGGVESAVFFWSQRWRPDATPRVDLAPMFFALCLLSASAADPRATFYAGLVALAAWALWNVRGARRGVVGWGVSVALAVALGWAGHHGLAEAQRVIERRAQALFLSWARRDPDPYRTTTSLGEIGELKLSERIVMRLEPADGVRVPILLRQATYNVYHAPSWLAADAAFVTVQSEPDGLTWVLRPETPADQRLTVSAYLSRGRGLLALPTGATRLEGLMAAGLARNRLGAVRVEDGLGLVTYGVDIPERGSNESPPGAGDLRLPPREVATLARVAGELQLAGLSPHAAIARVRAHLETFRYTRHLTGTRAGRTALEQFLLTTRAGHCEYFATAATLLLRAAGVPARYAVGYAAHEWSRIEHRWVVRGRDAHAWTLAWVDGAWIEVDTTPPAWITEDDGPDSAWQPVSDLWEWTTFLFARWRWSERQDRVTDNLGWLLVPLVAVLAWRLWTRRRVGPPSLAAPARDPGPRPGADSEFYRVERRLTELGFARAPGEPLTHWLDAVAATSPAVRTAPLRPLLALHYRHRFDPAGLAASERRQLRAQVEAWLAAHPPAPASARAAAP